jgi:hypothetical protein
MPAIGTRNESGGEALGAPGERIGARGSLREALAVLLILTVGVFFFYGGALRGYFLADDWWFINDKSFLELWKSFSGTWIGGLRGIGGFYRPLTRALFTLDSNLYGLDPSGYHLTNLLLHLGNAFLVYLIARRLLGRLLPALVSAIAFLIFPTHPEAVYWISGRTDLLFLFFSLLAIYSYIVFRERSCRVPWLALLFFFLALLAKETAITVPFLIIALNLCFFRVRLNIKSLLTSYGPFFLLLALYFVYRIVILGGLGGYPEQKANLTPRAFAVAFLDTSYTLFNAHRVASLKELRVLWAVLMAVWFFLTLSRRVPRIFLFGYLWIFISSLLLVNVELWGRFLYEAVVGYSLLLGGIFWVIGKQLRGRARIAALVPALAVMVFADGRALRAGVANWEKASQVAQDIVAQVHRLAPDPPHGSVFVVFHDTMNIHFRTTALQYYHDARLFPYDHLKNAIARSYPGREITCTWGFAPNVDYPDDTILFYVSSRYRVSRFHIAGRSSVRLNVRDISRTWDHFGHMDTFVDKGDWFEIKVQDTVSYFQSPPMHLAENYAVLRLDLRSNTLGIGRVFWGRGDEPIDWGASHFFSFAGDGTWREYFLNLGLLRDANCLRFSPIDRPGTVVIKNVEILLFSLK